MRKERKEKRTMQEEGGMAGVEQNGR